MLTGNLSKDPSIIIKAWCFPFISQFELAIQSSNVGTKVFSHLSLEPLVEALSNQLHDTLINYLQVELKLRQIPLPQNTSLADQTTQALAAFALLVEPDSPMSYLCGKYPLLLQELELQTSNFIKNITVILERVFLNYEVLLNGFFEESIKQNPNVDLPGSGLDLGGKPNVVLAKIKLAHGDPHKLGEQVAILEFEHLDLPDKCYGRVVYKPSSVMADAQITGDIERLKKIIPPKQSKGIFTSSFVEIMNLYLQDEKKLPVYLIFPCLDITGASYGFIEFLSQTPSATLDVDEQVREGLQKYQTEDRLKMLKSRVPRLWQESLERDYFQMKLLEKQGVEKSKKTELTSISSVNEAKPLKRADSASYVPGKVDDVHDSTASSKDTMPLHETSTAEAAHEKETEPKLSIAEVLKSFMNTELTHDASYRNEALATDPNPDPDPDSDSDSDPDPDPAPDPDSDPLLKPSQKRKIFDCVFETQEEYELFSFQAGLFGFIAVFLRITDLHNENMIVHKLKPFFIDLECAFQQFCNSIAFTHMLDNAFGALSNMAVSVHSYKLLLGDSVFELNIELPEKNRLYIEDNGKLTAIKPDPSQFLSGFLTAEMIIRHHPELFSEWLDSPAIQSLFVRTLPFATDKLTQIKDRLAAQVTEEDWLKTLEAMYQASLNKWISSMRAEGVTAGGPCCEVLHRQHVEQQFKSGSIPVYFMQVNAQQLFDYRGKVINFLWQHIKASKHVKKAEFFIGLLAKMNKSDDQILLQKAEKTYSKDLFYLQTSLTLVYQTFKKIVKNTYGEEMQTNMEYITQLLEQNKPMEEKIKILQQKKDEAKKKIKVQR